MYLASNIVIILKFCRKRPFSVSLIYQEIISGGGGGGCFASNAMVATPTEEVAMENVKIGQKVLTSKLLHTLKLEQMYYAVLHCIS